MVTTRSKLRSANGEFDFIANGTFSTNGQNRESTVPNGNDANDQHPKKRRRILRSSQFVTDPLATLDRKADGPVKSALDHVPLDVIFEIFSFLHPLDLVRLMLTSKSIHRILISTTSASIWRNARLAIDPSTPDCPPDQSEPQWAILLYETSCMLCDSTGYTYVQWYLRLRGCMPCLEKILISRREIPKKFRQIKGLIQRPEIPDRRGKTGERFPQVEDLDEILKLFPSSSSSALCIYWRESGPWYYRASVKKTVAALVSFQKEARSEVQDAKERLEAFKEARKREAFAVMNPEPVLMQWILDASRVYPLELLPDDLANWPAATTNCMLDSESP